MPAQTVANRIKWGVLALPVAGLIAVVSVPFGYIDDDPTVDPEGFAEQAISASVDLSTLGFTVANILFLFGFFALYAYMANGRAERWALAARSLASWVSSPL